MKTYPKMLTLVAAVSVSGCTFTMSTQPPGDPAPVVEAAPDVEVVDEGPDVPIVAVDEYYFVGGRYYYWHPGLYRYVALRGYPPAGYRVARMEHLMAHDRRERAFESRPAERREQPHPQQQRKAQPNQKQKKSNQ